METNGDVTMETNDEQQVKIELVSHSKTDCWTADFRNNNHLTIFTLVMSLFALALILGE